MSEPRRDPDMERACLGCMILSETAADEVSSMLDADDFYIPAHQAIYRAISKLARDGVGVDLVTIKNALISDRLLKDVGGVDYLIQLAESTPSAHLASGYARTLADLSTSRRVLQAAADIARCASSNECNGLELIARSDAILDDVRKLRKVGSRLVQVSTIVRSFTDRLERIIESGEPERGVPTGLIGVDKLTNGLMPGELVYVGGRTSMGKTALMAGMAINAARAQKGKVAIFSIEMSAEALVRRMVSMLSGVSMGQMLRPDISEDVFSRLCDACETISRLDIMIDDAAGISTIDVQGRLRQIAEKSDLSAVFVDHVGKMRSPTKIDNRVQELKQISQGLCSISKTFSVPVVAAVQINRGTEGRSDKRPTMSDIRESGDLEQDADKILLLYRPSYYKAKDDTKFDPSATEEAELIVAKNRNGPQGVVAIGFQPTYARFVNVK